MFPVFRGLLSQSTMKPPTVGRSFASLFQQRVVSSLACVPSQPIVGATWGRFVHGAEIHPHSGLTTTNSNQKGSNRIYESRYWGSSRRIEPSQYSNIPSTCARFFSTIPINRTDDNHGESGERADTSAKKKSASGRTKRDAITITPRAAGRILELLAQPSATEAIGIRLGVRRRGCNGLSYTLNYAMESDRLTKGMEEISVHGVTVLIEPMALFNVVGTTMDWQETDLSSEFVFENPNSKGKCGCGESFNV